VSIYGVGGKYVGIEKWS